MKNGKVFKAHFESRKRKCEPWNTHHDACRSLTLVHSKVSKHSNYTTCFTNSTVKATLEPTIGNHDLEYLDNWYLKQK